MAKKHITVGIIGTGFGRATAQNFKTVCPSCKVFLTGRREEKTAVVAKEISADGTYSNWQELVSAPEVDLVVIASPSSLHREMFELAAQNEKNILLEKPAAISVKDIGIMDELASRTNKLVVVNHEGRFHPVIQYLRDLVRHKKLGNIQTIRVGAYLNWYSNPDYRESWNNFKELGGGQIFAVGTHQIDLARFLLDMPTITSGSVQTVVFQDPRFEKKADAESQFSAHFLTAGGTSLQLFNDCYCFGYKNFTIEIIGSKGIALYGDLEGLMVSYANDTPPQKVVWVDPLPGITLGNSILTKSMKYMVKALVEAITTGTTNDNFCTLKQAKENLKAFETYK